MLYHYICNNCIGCAAGKPITDLSVDQYNELAARFIVEIEHSVNETPRVECNACNGPMRRAIGVESVYVRGYGLNDKRGAKTDMNLYQMLTNDPYKEHRKPADSSDLILKLKQSKDYNPKARRVFT